MCIVALELVIRQGHLRWTWWGVPLLVWGYAQYRLSGNYRTAHGGGGPGIEVPPERIVDSGIYAYTRNPLYLGSLILAISLNLVNNRRLIIVDNPEFHMSFQTDLIAYVKCPVCVCGLDRLYSPVPHTVSY